MTTTTTTLLTASGVVYFMAYLIQLVHANSPSVGRGERTHVLGVWLDDVEHHFVFRNLIKFLLIMVDHQGKTTSTVKSTKHQIYTSIKTPHRLMILNLKKK